MKRFLIGQVFVLVAVAVVWACGDFREPEPLAPDRLAWEVHPSIKRDQCAKDPIPPGWVERCEALEEPEEPEEPEDSTTHEPEPDPDPEPEPDPDPEPGEFYADGFEDDPVGQVPAGDGSFGWAGAGNAKVSAEIARSGSQSLRFPVPLQDSYNNEQRWAMGRQLTEVWVEFWLYHPDGVEGIAGVDRWTNGRESTANVGSGNKFIRMWGADYNEPNKVGLNIPSTGSTAPGIWDSRIKTVAWSTSVNTHLPLQQLSPFIHDPHRGAWTQIRIHWRMDDGSGNDLLEFWRDGVLEFSENRGNTGGPFAVPYWDQGYFFGFHRNGAEFASAIYLDDIRFYAADPGW